jgi:hypothetical protein
VSQMRIPSVSDPACSTPAIAPTSTSCFRHARLLRIEHEAQRQREFKWERERQEVAERARKAPEEEERVQNLERCIDNWAKAQQIRAFVDEYEKMSLGKEEPIGPESSRGQWIAWARRKADWFDPLIEKESKTDSSSAI